MRISVIGAGCGPRFPGPDEANSHPLDHSASINSAPVGYTDCVRQR